MSVMPDHAMLAMNLFIRYQKAVVKKFKRKNIEIIQAKLNCVNTLCNGSRGTESDR